jgi:hypothetical protein
VKDTVTVYLHIVTSDDDTLNILMSEVWDDVEIFYRYLYLSSPTRTMPRVTYFSKVRIITLAQNGMSQRQISATLGIPKSTISATTHRHNLIDTC